MGLIGLDESFLWINKNCKRRKVKAACLVQFIGSNYSGFQILENLGLGTVEGCLQQALFKAGAIYYRNIEKLSKIGWKRVSRTDKGVHSSGSIISLKLQNPYDTFPELSAEVNKFLPTDIRLVCITRFTKNFNCYYACADRTYNYILPSHSLTSYRNNHIIANALTDKAYSNNRIISETANNGHNKNNERAENLSMGQLHRIGRILSEFEGTHHFHNFTRNRPEKDKNVGYYQRYIKRMRLVAVFRYKGTEFVQIEIKGQSFIYNQIRKMIGFFIQRFRGLEENEGDFGENYQDLAGNDQNLAKNHENLAENHQNHEDLAENHETLAKNNEDLAKNHQNHEDLAKNHENLAENHENLAENHENLAKNGEIFKIDSKVKIPCAPALGLFLKETSFYDKKSRSPVDFGQKGEIDSFIENRIIPEICEKELSENSFEKWLKTENM